MILILENIKFMRPILFLFAILCVNTEMIAQQGAYCGHDYWVDPNEEGGCTKHPSTNLCNANKFEMLRNENITGWSGIPGDWMRIINEDFNGPLLDSTIWLPMTPWTNDDEVHYSNDPHAVSLNLPENLSISNGILKFRGKYDNNPNVLYPRWRDGVWDNVHRDYTSAMISCKYKFPINSRYQMRMKVFPENHDNGTHVVLWGSGPSWEEIDLIETFDNTADVSTVANENQSMGVHGTYYGQVGSQFAEYTDRFHSNDLQQNMNDYGLIWDKWKVEFYFNQEGIQGIVNQFCKYYSCPQIWDEGWPTYYLENHIRNNPIGNYAAFGSAAINGDDFAVSPYFPDYAPVTFYAGFAIREGAVTTQYTANNTMDIDHIYIWLRANCTLTTTVTSLNYLGQNPTWLNDGTAYAMGKVVVTSAGTSLSVMADNNGVFAATDEIGLLDGFGVDADANFAAYITIPCETAWDQRTTDPSGTSSSVNENNEISGNSFQANQSWAENVVSYAENEIKISSDQNDFLGYEVYNSIGALVTSQENMMSKEIALNKNEFAPGIYYVKLKKEYGFDIKKILIQY